MRLLLAGGGTGGHIYPALALAQGIKRELPESEIMFVGTEHGLEASIIPAAGFPLRMIDISGIDRSSPVKAVHALLKIPRAMAQAARIVGQFHPDVVVGTGGYVSFPVVYAAAARGIKTAIHEQNAYPGIANRFLARRVDLVMLTFAEAADRLKARRVVKTGLPIRQTVLEANRTQARKENGLKRDVLTLLVFGGSLGAHTINQAILKMIELARGRKWHLIWITGRSEYETLVQQAGTVLNRGEGLKVEMHPYLDHIEVAMASADLAICRAGASTLSELQVLGLPAILVPYPHAAENHQEKNARSLEAAGAARIILDAEITGQRLLDEIERIIASGDLESMSAAMRKAARPQALEQMVALVRELARHSV